MKSPQEVDLNPLDFQANNKQPIIGKLLDDAMVAIERASPRLNSGETNPMLVA